MIIRHVVLYQDGRSVLPQCETFRLESEAQQFARALNAENPPEPATVRPIRVNDGEREISEWEARR